MTKHLPLIVLAALFATAATSAGAGEFSRWQRAAQCSDTGPLLSEANQLALCRTICVKRIKGVCVDWTTKCTQPSGARG